jgi:hypothetical protein
MNQRINDFTLFRSLFYWLILFDAFDKVQNSDKRDKLKIIRFFRNCLSGKEQTEDETRLIISKTMANTAPPALMLIHALFHSLTPSIANQLAEPLILRAAFWNANQFGFVYLWHINELVRRRFASLCNEQISTALKFSDVEVPGSYLDTLPSKINADGKLLNFGFKEKRLFRLESLMLFIACKEAFQDPALFKITEAVKSFDLGQYMRSYLDGLFLDGEKYKVFRIFDANERRDLSGKIETKNEDGRRSYFYGALRNKNLDFNFLHNFFKAYYEFKYKGHTPTGLISQSVTTVQLLHILDKIVLLNRKPDTCEKPKIRTSKISKNCLIQCFRKIEAYVEHLDSFHKANLKVFDPFLSEINPLIEKIDSFLLKQYEHHHLQSATK